MLGEGDKKQEPKSKGTWLESLASLDSLDWELWYCKNEACEACSAVALDWLTEYTSGQSLDRAWIAWRDSQ